MRVLASVLVKPSIQIMWIVRFMLVMSFGSIFYLALASDMEQMIYLFFALLVVIFVLFLRSLHRGVGVARTYHLEIDDCGEILMRSFEVGGAPQFTVARMKKFVIVWRQLIVLCVESESGVRKFLLISRDSVVDDGFRRLTVAVNYCAHRNLNSVDGLNNLSDGNF